MHTASRQQGRLFSTLSTSKHIHQQIVWFCMHANRCLTQFSRYICPRCNITYCSLPCYKQHSSGCTEAFYRFVGSALCPITASAHESTSMLPMTALHFIPAVHARAPLTAPRAYGRCSGCCEGGEAPLMCRAASLLVCMASVGIAHFTTVLAAWRMFSLCGMMTPPQGPGHLCPSGHKGWG